LVVVVDHMGKDLDRGTRGASAKEAHADFVMAMLGEKTLAGKLENPRLALRKLKEGPQGEEFAFEPRTVKMGRDQHGFEVTTVWIEWVYRPPPPRRERQRQESRSVGMIRQAVTEAIAAHGVDVEVNGRRVRAAPVGEVKAAFVRANRNWRPDSGDEARDRAWRRTMEWLRDQANGFGVDDAGTVREMKEGPSRSAIMG